MNKYAITGKVTCVVDAFNEEDALEALGEFLGDAGGILISLEVSSIEQSA